MTGKLYLIPNTIDAEAPEILPPYLTAAVKPIRHFFVEEEKSARRLLKKLDPAFPIQQCTFFSLNEHTPAAEVQKNFKAIADKDAGIISESGCPCVADPGAGLVLLAHQQKTEVVPLVGPSAIMLALMGSGLSGQNFAFNGYLPKDKPERIKAIKDLETRSVTQTQIFMEAPYRNEALLDDLLTTLNPKTLLCLAYDLTSPAQHLKTLPVKEWKTNKPAMNKHPALFLIQAQ